MLSSITTSLKGHLKRSKQSIQKRKYAGSAVNCPICGAGFREFASYGLKNRPNARCLNCRSLERDRLLWIYLEQETQILDATSFDEPIHLLHFAPEAHLYRRFSSSPRIDYTPTDFSPEKFVELPAGPSVVQADILDLGFADSSFDMLICNHVLEHIDNDQRAMSELFRVMKAGASAIIMVPINYFDLPPGYDKQQTYENASVSGSKERKLHFGQKDHVRIYGLDIIDRLKTAGFAAQANYYARQFTAEEQFRYGFKQDEIIFTVQKPT